MSKNTFIQIDNVGFINKGAELMLYAIIDRLSKEKNLEPIFIAGLNFQGTPEQIRKAGLYQFFDLQRYKIKWQNHFTQKQLSRYGLARRDSVNVILDAGGFQFGDQWSNFYTQDLNQKLKEYYTTFKKTGCKIVFLPQAFGPFTKPLARERMEIVFNYADILYAREKASYKYLTDLFGDSGKIRLAPDFTSLVSCDLPLKLYNRVKDSICLIPNARMTDKTDKQTAEAYKKFLHETSKLILERGEKLVLLNHEGLGDWSLIQDILQQLGNWQGHVEAINGLNALEVKAVIRHSKLLISSRFHGVVSGLNQGIPTLCTSWSHKYEELLADYKLSGNLLDIHNWGITMQAMSSWTTSPGHLSSKADTISLLKDRSEEMWREILKVL